MSMTRALHKVLYRSTLHGAIREIKPVILGYKGFVRLGRRRDAFWSMDPAASAQAARHAEREIGRMAEKAVHDMIREWIKGHNYDVDSLCGAGIEIRFKFGQSVPVTGEDCVDIIAEMYAVTPNS